jgi:adenine deaminase
MQSNILSVSGNVVDVIKKEIYPATLIISNGKIQSIKREEKQYDQFILPGLIDSHLHIESSMLIPSEFAREAVKHGTTATISDPHEIANVLGMHGIRFMIENGKKVPFRFWFGAPSCVPATPYETTGSLISPEDVEELLSWEEIVYLAEMMNYPGVVQENKEVMAKIQSALKRKKVIDGHAPGLMGPEAEKYFGAGISTDHECFTLVEAIFKANLGVKILIREGSAARNFDTLLPLLNSHPQQVMFCSDDKHPDELIKGHINKLVARAIAQGYDMFDVLAACTLNPTMHYNLTKGLLQEDDYADFIVVDSPSGMNVKQTWINGQKVYDEGNILFPQINELPVNQFNATQINVADVMIKSSGGPVKVIKAIENEIVTGEMKATLPVSDGYLQPDPGNDILKIVVLNRFESSPPAVAFIHNFGLKSGAIASTVAHDSHNIIAVGADDYSLCKAINHLIEIKGGICVVDELGISSLPLPVAGLMSLKSAKEVSHIYHDLDSKVKKLGSQLSAPFMTLSFMSLLVIPKLKLSDKGLFDGQIFEFVSLDG